MARRTFDSILSMIRKMQEQGVDKGSVFSEAMVRRMIEKYIGADKITVAKYLRLMVQHNLIVRVEGGVTINDDLI